MSDKRRVVFCTYPSVYSYIVLQELLKSPDIQVVGVILSTRVISKRYSIIRGSLRHIQLSGLRYAGYLFAITTLYQWLRWLVKRPTLVGILKSNQISYLETNDINTELAYGFLKETNPEVLLSAHFNQLIKSTILNFPLLGCLNIHPSLLPRLQGVDPAFYALLRRVPETGVTVHFQNEEFDKGAILEQVTLKLRWQDSLLLLNTKLFKLGAIAAIKQIIGLGEYTEGTLQTGNGRYDSWPNPYDTKQFYQQRRYFAWYDYWKLVQNL